MFDARFSGTQHQIDGGADRDRTGGLLVANQALSQLSYSPLPSFEFRVSRFEPSSEDRHHLLETGNLKLATDSGGPG